ncbi:MAG: hypothetical protein EXS59_01830 [Candidatus Taylorbacteria bacterium]|nr:hypothetical protein [Candidatus Taylorbacteria bacterium]
MSNAKFSAVTKGFQKAFIKNAGGKSAANSNVRKRKLYKKLANRAARRVWFDTHSRATDYCW